MVKHGFKCKNIPSDYLKTKKKRSKKSSLDVTELEGFDWAYVLNTENRCSFTKTTTSSRTSGDDNHRCTQSLKKEVSNN